MNLLTQIKHKTQKGEEVIMDIGAKASNALPENFVEQKERSNLAAKDKLPVIFGKLSKWYADLRPVAWSGSYSDLTNKPTIPEGSAANYQVANNDTTEAEGFVADARIVRTHGLEIDGLSRDLGGCSFEQDGVDFYIVGADAVRKKLTGNDIYEIAYNEGNGWAGKETIQLDVTNIPDYATLSLDSFKYVALLSSSGTGGATEEITGSYMGVKVLGYDSGSGKLSIQTANAYRPIFIVVIE